MDNKISAVGFAIAGIVLFVLAAVIPGLWCVVPLIAAVSSSLSAAYFALEAFVASLEDNP